MATVLSLRRTLTERPRLPSVPGVRLRNYAGPADIETWLDLRHRAFAREKVGVRCWEASDFESEFLARPWWSPERLWFAEATTPPKVAGTLRAPSARKVAGTLRVPSAEPAEAIGTICLAQRGTGEHARPAVHWLAVLPFWRRRGVGKLLLAALEAACWDAGHRQVFLETHAQWTAALRFYESHGYRPQ
ncbi:MAG: GNAT family N-acetyltransferase [Pirellulales bacterium]